MDIRGPEQSPSLLLGRFSFGPFYVFVLGHTGQRQHHPNVFCSSLWSPPQAGVHIVPPDRTCSALSTTTPSNTFKHGPNSLSLVPFPKANAPPGPQTERPEPKPSPTESRLLVPNHQREREGGRAVADGKSCLVDSSGTPTTDNALFQGSAFARFCTGCCGRATVEAHASPRHPCARDCHVMTTDTLVPSGIVVAPLRMPMCTALFAIGWGRSGRCQHGPPPSRSHVPPPRFLV